MRISTGRFDTAKITQTATNSEPRKGLALGRIDMTFEEDLREKLKDRKFKEGYDDLEASYTLIETLIRTRNEEGITQAELAKRTGIAQSELSKIETGEANPSLKRINRIAKGLGRKVQITFAPRD